MPYTPRITDIEMTNCALNTLTTSSIGTLTGCDPHNPPSAGPTNGAEMSFKRPTDTAWSAWTTSTVSMPENTQVKLRMTTEPNPNTVSSTSLYSSGFGTLWMVDFCTLVDLPNSLGTQSYYNRPVSTICVGPETATITGIAAGNITISCDHAMSVKRPGESAFSWWTAGPIDVPNNTQIKVRATTPSMEESNVHAKVYTNTWTQGDVLLWDVVLSTHVTEPIYNTSPWNSSPFQAMNSNYNYACDIRNTVDVYNVMTPGTGVPTQPCDCSSISLRATNDGLEPISGYTSSYIPAYGHVVALITWPTGGGNYDYRFYRRDKGGTWSYKHQNNSLLPSGYDLPVTNLDQNANVITDIATCAKPANSTICGYYLCPKTAMSYP